MGSKITLYTDEKLIEDVKRFAKDQNISVSKLVNNFFESLLQKEKENKQESSVTDSLLGVLKDTALDEKDYKKHLEKKHL